MASPVEVVLSMAKALAAKPDQVQAQWLEAERAVELRVAPEDRGKIIGRRGKTIDSLRILVNTVQEAGAPKVDVKLLEE